MNYIAGLETLAKSADAMQPIVAEIINLPTENKLRYVNCAVRKFDIDDDCKGIAERKIAIETAIKNKTIDDSVEE